MKSENFWQREKGGRLERVKAKLGQLGESKRDSVDEIPLKLFLQWAKRQNKIISCTDIVHTPRVPPLSSIYSVYATLSRVAAWALI